MFRKLLKRLFGSKRVEICLHEHNGKSTLYRHNDDTFCTVCRETDIIAKLPTIKSQLPVTEAERFVVELNKTTGSIRHAVIRKLCPTKGGSVIGLEDESLYHMLAGWKQPASDPATAQRLSVAAIRRLRAGRFDDLGHYGPIKIKKITDWLDNYLEGA